MPYVWILCAQFQIMVIDKTFVIPSFKNVLNCCFLMVSDSYHSAGKTTLSKLDS